MTHELQAPLSAIQSYLQLMLEEYLTPEQHKEVLQKCITRLDEEKKLIGDLMELGRLQAIGPAADTAPDSKTPPCRWRFFLCGPGAPGAAGACAYL